MTQISKFISDRRRFLFGAGSVGLVWGGAVLRPMMADETNSVPRPQSTAPKQAPGFETLTSQEWRNLSPEQWRERLSEKSFGVLRLEDTERAFTSPLNDEKRDGWYACAGCGNILFSSEHKYDSGTGWPSFFDHVPGRLAIKTDYKLIYPRREYHCARCLGHQGHVFSDGPKPTGQRWCNNGVSLIFTQDAV